MAGGVRLEMDGAPLRLGDAMAYKGIMFSGVPNFATIFGYTNASWTLKADLAAAYLCRLLDRMRRRRARSVVPRRDPAVGQLPFLDFTSGYVKRASAELPSQGDRGPWRLPQSSFHDVVTLRYGRIEDGVLDFAR
jgi:cyclohexanone monooxygenase